MLYMLRNLATDNEDTKDSHAIHRPASEQLLGRNVQRFQGGLVFKTHRLLCHTTLGSRVIKKKKKDTARQRARTWFEIPLWGFQDAGLKV